MKRSQAAAHYSHVNIAGTVGSIMGTHEGTENGRRFRLGNFAGSVPSNTLMCNVTCVVFIKEGWKINEFVRAVLFSRALRRSIAALLFSRELRRSNSSAHVAHRGIFRPAFSRWLPARMLRLGANL